MIDAWRIMITRRCGRRELEVLDLEAKREQARDAAEVVPDPPAPQHVDPAVAAKRPGTKRAAAGKPDPEHPDERDHLAEQKPPEHRDEPQRHPVLARAQPEHEVDDGGDDEKQRREPRDEHEKDELEPDPANAPEDARAAWPVVGEKGSAGDRHHPHPGDPSREPALARAAPGSSAVAHMIGLPEILIVLLLLLLFFGYKKLPQLGRSAGEGVKTGIGKAKELGAAVGEKAEGKVDPKDIGRSGRQGAARGARVPRRADRQGDVEAARRRRPPRRPHRPHPRRAGPAEPAPAAEPAATETPEQVEPQPADPKTGPA